MRTDNRLTAVLHALLHMAEQKLPLTSEQLATCMHTNPVVVRRTMAGLREAGYVHSVKGHGGGWSIACDLQQVTLRDIHDALGVPLAFAIGKRSEQPDCLVEQAVNAAMGDALQAAEALLLARLGKVTLADLSADFHRRMAAHSHHSREHKHGS